MTEKNLSAIYQEKAATGITSIEVEGFKSLGDPSKIEVRHLTILAGANSSGKSSIMQPLLMMKQTLEAPYDPGALLLDGPNVKFTSVDQFLSKRSGKKIQDIFKVRLLVNQNILLENCFTRSETTMDLNYSIWNLNEKEFTIKRNMSETEVISLIDEFERYREKSGLSRYLSQKQMIIEHLKPEVIRNRCFLTLYYRSHLDPAIPTDVLYSNEIHNQIFEKEIRQIIHIPGVRGNPERTYKIAAIGSGFPGNFETYVASIIQHWQDTQDERLIQLCQNLENMGLTGKVATKILNGVQMEIQVANLPASSELMDMVNIADVGFGVSQILPVLVALLVAKPGQLVYLEQPEIHLHPRAQEGLAQVLADAANRGVRIVLETHSELLLLTVQSLVAEGKLLPEKVKLHWFTRREDGITEIHSADLDRQGAFGDWPEDFSQVSLHLESRYLDASESHVAAD